jgi:hypothetical protein
MCQGSLVALGHRRLRVPPQRVLHRTGDGRRQHGGQRGHPVIPGSATSERRRRLGLGGRDPGRRTVRRQRPAEMRGPLVEQMFDSFG